MVWNQGPEGAKWADSAENRLFRSVSRFRKPLIRCGEMPHSRSTGDRRGRNVSRYSTVSRLYKALTIPYRVYTMMT